MSEARARFAERRKRLEAQVLAAQKKRFQTPPGLGTPGAATVPGPGAEAAAFDSASELDRYKTLLAERHKAKTSKKRLFRPVLGVPKRNHADSATPDQQNPPQGATTTMKANKPGTTEYKDRRESMLEYIRKTKGQNKAKEVESRLNAANKAVAFQKVVSKPRLIEKLPIIKRMVKMSYEETLILDASLSFMHGLKFVFKSKNALQENEQQALEDWLHLMRIALPQEWALHELIDDLLDNFELAIKSDDALQRILNRHTLPRKSWSWSCAPPGKIGGGFTCGFWKLLHTMSVGVAEHKGGLNVIKARTARRDSILFSPEIAADTVREYIVNFFPCTDCAQHFAQRYDDCSYRRCSRLSDKVSRATDADWKELAKWLWEFHNEVSVRLLHEKADRQRKHLQRSHMARVGAGPGAASTHEEVSVLWPSINDCITCFHGDGRWNEDAVFVYLEKQYWYGMQLASQHRPFS